MVNQNTIRDWIKKFLMIAIFLLILPALIEMVAGGVDAMFGNESFLGQNVPFVATIADNNIILVIIAATIVILLIDTFMGRGKGKF